MKRLRWPGGSLRSRRLCRRFNRDPAAKLVTARALDETTVSHSLGVTLGLGEVNVKEVYAAFDRLGTARPSIETALARRHLSDGTLVPHDVSSSYVEGRCCELARFGHSRDSVGFCARPLDVRSRSKCSKATPTTPRHLAIRSPNSKSASDLSVWSWSTIVG